MYVKFIGSLCFVGITSTIGVLKAEDLVIRVKRMQELKRMIGLLQGELRFHRAALSESFENVAERMSTPFSEFLLSTAKSMESRSEGNFEEIWEKNSTKLLLEKGFFKEDEQIFSLLKNGLGHLDLKMQTETLNLALLHTEEMIEAAKEEQKIKGKLYRTMGVTTGALLALLVI